MSAPESYEKINPMEIATIFAEVAQRSAKLIGSHIKRQAKKGISAPSDDLGLARAYLDMMAKMLTNPMPLMQAQMSLVNDETVLVRVGADAAAPPQTWRRCKPGIS